MQGYIIISTLVLLLIIIIFAGFFNHINRMALSTPPEGIAAGDASRWSIGAMMILVVFVVMLGIYIPSQFYEMIMKVVDVVNIVDVGAIANVGNATVISGM